MTKEELNTLLTVFKKKYVNTYYYRHEGDKHGPSTGTIMVSDFCNMLNDIYGFQRVLFGRQEKNKDSYICPVFGFDYCGNGYNDITHSFYLRVGQVGPFANASDSQVEFAIINYKISKNEMGKEIFADIYFKDFLFGDEHKYKSLDEIVAFSKNRFDLDEKDRQDQIALYERLRTEIISNKLVEDPKEAESFIYRANDYFNHKVVYSRIK